MGGSGEGTNIVLSLMVANAQEYKIGCRHLKEEAFFIHILSFMRKDVLLPIEYL